MRATLVGLILTASQDSDHLALASGIDGRLATYLLADGLPRESAALRLNVKWPNGFTCDARLTALDAQSRDAILDRISIASRIKQPVIPSIFFRGTSAISADREVGEGAGQAG